jgi:TolB protein
VKLGFLRASVSAVAVLLVSMAVAMTAVSAVAAAEEPIVYSCGYDLCTIDPDNPTAQRNLTETDPVEGQERSPSWSPDGKWIAYFANYEHELYDVWVLDPTVSAALSEPTDISNTAEANGNFGTPPVWSSDSTRVAFEEEWFNSTLTGTDVFVSRFDGTTPALPIGQTKQGEFHPTWSPDGTRLAYSHAGAAYIANADGSGIPAALGKSAGNAPYWSPDGRYIAMENPGPYPYEVRMVNADGSDFHLLGKVADLGLDADWSPDGKRIAYVDDEEPSGGNGALDQIWVAPADGSSEGNQVPMPPGWIVPHNPTFSPDGTRVAFDARPVIGAGYEQILVGPADGSAAAVPITSGEAQNQEPDWKPGPSTPPAGGGSGAGGGGTEGGSGGGGGNSGGGSGGGAPGTGTGSKAGGPGGQTPVKVRLAGLKRNVIANNGHMLATYVDCNAPGGHPTGKVAEICAAAANAKPSGVQPAGFALAAAGSKAKPKTFLFAKGSVKVPVGGKKPLNMTLTAKGKELLAAKKQVKVKLEVKLTPPGGKAETVVKTITVKQGSGKH